MNKTTASTRRTPSHGARTTRPGDRGRRDSPMTRFHIHGLGFTLFLALLTALPALSIDMALPSLAFIQADLHAPQAQAAAVIAIFSAGFSSAPIVVGPLADRFGRKAIMATGLVIFTLCAAGSALARVDSRAARLPPCARGERGSDWHPAESDHSRPVRGPRGAPATLRGLRRVRRRAAGRARAWRSGFVLRLLAPDLRRADRRLRPRDARRAHSLQRIACAGETPEPEALDDFRGLPARPDESRVRGLFAARRSPVRGPFCLCQRFAASVHAGLWRVENRFCGLVRSCRIRRDRRFVDQRVAAQPRRQGKEGPRRRDWRSSAPLRSRCWRSASSALVRRLSSPDW